MKNIFIISCFFAFLIIACTTSKKATTSTTTTESSAASATKSDPLIPGDTQLSAIKTKYPDATAEQLKEGHSIYIGACTNCHGQKNIYKRSEESWLHEIDEMSPKANLTATQKDALTKYVLSMKAVATVPTK